MPKRLDRPLDKRIVNFFEGDMESLKEFYPNVPHTVIVRELVHQHIKKLRERDNRTQANDQPNLAELVDLGDLAGS